MDFDLFLGHMAVAKQCSPETLKAYRSDLVQFENFMLGQGLRRINQLNNAVLNTYIESMREKDNPRFKRSGLSESSIARRLAAVSSYIEFRKLSGHAGLKNPVKDIHMKWRRNRDPKPVDEFDLDFLLTGITELRDRVLVQLFLATGLRISEMHQLNRDSISIEQDVTPNGEIRTMGRGEVAGKGGKRRIFFVDENALRVLADYDEMRKDQNPAMFVSERNKRMSKRSMQWILDKWCKRTGLRHINVHRLRHSYATRLANAGIPSTILKELMGHSSFVTTQQYFKLTDKTLARGYFSAMESRYRS